MAKVDRSKGSRRKMHQRRPETPGSFLSQVTGAANHRGVCSVLAQGSHSSSRVPGLFGNQSCGTSCCVTLDGPKTRRHLPPCLCQRSGRAGPTLRAIKERIIPTDMRNLWVPSCLGIVTASPQAQSGTQGLAQGPSWFPWTFARPRQPALLCWLCSHVCWFFTRKV